MRADQARALTSLTQTPFDVLPSNWTTLQVFLACATQWRISTNGVYLGLDYAAVDAVMRFLRIKNRTDVFTRLRLMEQAALESMRKLYR